MNTQFDPPSEPTNHPRKGDFGGDMITEECPDCNGDGFTFRQASSDVDDIVVEKCERCKGTGEIEEEDLPE